MSSRGDAAGSLVGERALIEHIRKRLPSPPASLLVGPGDDAAVLVPERGAFQVLTTDVLVEGVHFDRRFSSLEDAGYKALAVNLSDLAAMGAAPDAALLSLILPAGTTTGDVDGLLDGFFHLAAETRVALAGGNISRSPGPLIVDVTAVGHARPRRILTRGGGKPGDALFVSGSLGAAAAGLDWLNVRLKADATQGDPADPGGSRSFPEEHPSGSTGFRLQAEEDARADEMTSCILRHRRPEPRVRLGTLLGRTRAASACMDLSDGLADAVTQIANASGTGAIVRAELLPIDPDAGRWFERRGLEPTTAAVTGGDDFELLFAVPRKHAGRLRAVVRAARGLPLTRIGELTGDRTVALDRGGQLEPMPSGYQHF